jgi:hypothetical protein
VEAGKVVVDNVVGVLGKVPVGIVVVAAAVEAGKEAADIVVVVAAAEVVVADVVKPRSY